QGGGPELEEIYASEARANGHEPGFCMIPPIDTATTVFVAEDIATAWAELGPHLLHDVTAYAAINEGNTHTASLSTATTIDELRAEDRTHRIVTVDQAVAMIKSGAPLPLQPLAGGLPPAIARRSPGTA